MQAVVSGMFAASFANSGFCSPEDNVSQQHLPGICTGRAAITRTCYLAGNNCNLSACLPTPALGAQDHTLRVNPTQLAQQFLTIKRCPLSAQVTLARSTPSRCPLSRPPHPHHPTPPYSLPNP